jgi:hypothetical protein
MMIDPAELTVRDLLPADMHAMDKTVGDALRDDPALQKAHLPGGLTGPIADRVVGAVTGVLNVKILTLLADAWAKAREIRGYRTPDATHPADTTTTLFLGEHELSADLHPVAELDFSSVSHLTLRFTVTVSARLRAAQLSIRNGHIIEIGKTDGSVSATLKYGGVPLHKELRSQDWVLVGDHVLAEPGIAIP